METLNNNNRATPHQHMDIPPNNECQGKWQINPTAERGLTPHVVERRSRQPPEACSFGSDVLTRGARSIGAISSC